MRTRTINGSLFDGRGQPLVGETVTFVLRRLSYIGDAAIIPSEIQATTDGSGDFSITLWCNDDGLSPVKYECTLPNGERFPILLPYSALDIRFETLLAM